MTMYPRLECVAAWMTRLGWSAMLLSVASLAFSQTATIIVGDAMQMSTPCTNPRVVRKGQDLLIRCANKPDDLWFRVVTFYQNCPAPKATQDAAGNLTLRC
jgi:hypothetical protein